MPTNYGILYDRDKRVRVFNNDIPVVASNLQSVYSKFLNFKGDRFDITANNSLKAYDIALKYPDQIIPYEGGAAQGTVPGYLDFDDNHFDVSALTSGKYIITSNGWVKVNALAVAPLNIANATNNEAVTVASGTNVTNLTFNNDEVAVYNNGSLINSTGPSALNFSTDFTTTNDAANDRVNIGLGGGFLPLPQNKKWGVVVGGQQDTSVPFGNGLFNLKYNYTDGTIAGGNDTTHGHFRRYAMGGSDNDLLGLDTSFAMTRLAYNPHLYGKIAIPVLDDSRFYLGWNSNDIGTGNNDLLTNLSGFGIGFQYDTAETEDTVWSVYRNDGDATEDKVSLGPSLSSTTPFTFELIGDTANNRWGWNLNGGAFTYYTTEIPIAATDLRWTFRIEEIGGGGMSFDIYYLYWVQDK